MSWRKVALRAGTMEQLAAYLGAQLGHLFPTPDAKSDAERVLELLPAALGRMRPILDGVRAFETDRFDHLNSLQHATLTYLLSSEAGRARADKTLAERLFLLNRALNGIDLFYAVDLPEVFFFSHGVGSVLGNVRYGERLVIFHNVTVGRVGDKRPVIGRDVVLYPGAVVTGRSVIGAGSVIAAGTAVHDVEIPDNSVVGTAGDGGLRITPRTKDYVGLYLHPAKP